MKEAPVGKPLPKPAARAPFRPGAPARPLPPWLEIQIMRDLDDWSNSNEIGLCGYGIFTAGVAQ